MRVSHADIHDTQKVWFTIFIPGSLIHAATLGRPTLVSYSRLYMLLNCFHRIYVQPLSYEPFTPPFPGKHRHYSDSPFGLEADCLVQENVSGIYGGDVHLPRTKHCSLRPSIRLQIGNCSACPRLKSPMVALSLLAHLVYMPSTFSLSIWKLPR